VLELRGIRSDPRSVIVDAEGADWSREGEALFVSLAERADATTVGVEL